LNLRQNKPRATIAKAVNFGRRIRMAAYWWHCFVARSERATGLYILAIAAVAALTPNRRMRDMIEWLVTGQRVPWKPLAFASRKVLVGDMTEIRLNPHLGEFDQAALFRSKLGYEVPIFAWLERHAPGRYDAVIEIGANVGIYSVFFDALIKRCPSGRLRRIYAFEPSRMAYLRLLANLDANDARFVDPFAAAVSDETGFASFFEPDGHLTNGSLERGFAQQFSNTVRSSMVVTLAGSTLADLFDRHQRVLLKIDAEGSEPRILSAMALVLTRHRPDLLIEVLEGADERLQALECLDGYAYFLLTAEGPSRRPALIADTINRDWLLTTSPTEI
jgi:FkbM family methyltransferase